MIPLDETDENFNNPDNETCSRCLRLFPWSRLSHVKSTGENVCGDCR